MFCIIEMGSDPVINDYGDEVLQPYFTIAPANQVELYDEVRFTGTEAACQEWIDAFWEGFNRDHFNQEDEV